jgi:archaellum component FlaC
MEKALEQILVSMQEQIADLGSQMNSRFDVMEKRLDGVDERFDGVDKRLDAMDKRFDAVDERFDNLTTEMRSHFKHIETKLDHHEKLYQVVSNELNAAKIDIEYLSEKAGVHDKEINQLKKTIKV